MTENSDIMPTDVTGVKRTLVSNSGEKDVFSLVRFNGFVDISKVRAKSLEAGMKFTKDFPWHVEWHEIMQQSEDGSFAEKPWTKVKEWLICDDGEIIEEGHYSFELRIPKFNHRTPKEDKKC